MRTNLVCLTAVIIYVLSQVRKTKIEANVSIDLAKRKKKRNSDLHVQHNQLFDMFYQHLGIFLKSNMTNDKREIF